MSFSPSQTKNPLLRPNDGNISTRWSRVIFGIVISLILSSFGRASAGEAMNSIFDTEIDPSQWQVRKSPEAARPMVTDGKLRLNAKVTGASHRSAIIKREGLEFDPLSRGVAVKAEGLELAGEPGNGANNFFIMLLCSPIPDQKMTFPLAKTDKGEACGILLIKSAEGYELRVSQTLGGQGSPVVTLHLSTAPTAIEYILEPGGSNVTVKLSGSTFQENGKDSAIVPLPGTLSEQLWSSAPPTSRRLIVGVFNGGEVGEPSQAAFSSLSVSLP